MFLLLNRVPAISCKNIEQRTENWNIYYEVAAMSSMASASSLSLTTRAGAVLSRKATAVELEVMQLFGEFRSPLLRYAISFGLPVHDAEEIVQEVFLSLFKHLQQRKSRQNLRGWIFRVTHNLALKQRYANQKLRDRIDGGEFVLEEQFDPSPDPEFQLSSAQRQQRLMAVVGALPEVDQGCLRLRAEGLRYREIAAALGISLGAVSISLSRSLGRLMRADRR
jgi:RNA polymerase sigma-70 factor, ECF subfamily